jgi:arabinose-5-phosphate isomerase
MINAEHDIFLFKETKFIFMNIEDRASEILKTQLSALNGIKITPSIVTAIKKIASMNKSSGKVITTGMGKAGIIATKMSATLASIGFPSFFVHPAEAAHGDIGRISSEDLIIVFSHSGTTGEVVNMINSLHSLNSHKNFIICITSSQNPTIPTDLTICYGSIQESCIVSKVPSTSTTMMLILADILAITSAESLGLNDDWFKVRHPGGAIGQSYKKSDK